MAQNIDDLIKGCNTELRIILTAQKFYILGMIKSNLRAIPEKNGVTTAYQLQQLTDVSSDTAASLWRDEWKAIYLKTLNTLCNVFKCEPQDFLIYTKDEEEN